MKNRNDVIEVDCRVIDTKEYSSFESFFVSIPEILNPLVHDAENSLKMIEKELYKSPVFIETIEALVPKEMYVALLSDKQKRQLAKGTLKLMTRKNGKLLAKLVNPKNNRIVRDIDINKIKLSPEASRAMIDFSSQMQMAQIMEEVHKLQVAVEQVHIGIESDRLALAYSLQEKFKLAYRISNKELRTQALLRVALDAEDVKNKLMLSQRDKIRFITSQSKNIAMKIINTPNTKENDRTMTELRESMCALNMASVVEALAYQGLGETDVAVNSLKSYTEFMKLEYGNKKVLERLDQLDPVDAKYWTHMLPIIQNKINELPCKSFKSINHEGK